MKRATTTTTSSPEEVVVPQQPKENSAADGARQSFVAAMAADATISSSSKEKEERMVEPPLPPRPRDEEPSRTQRLRDAVWVREAMDDLVAAEFALRLDLADNTTDKELVAEAGSLSSVSGPDFERLREQLDRRCDELMAAAGATATSESERENLAERMRQISTALDSAAKRDSVKRARLRKLMEQRSEDQVIFSNETIGRRVTRWAEDVWLDLVKRGDAVAELGRLAVRGSSPYSENRTAVLYVRGDGSVDWEGALQGARAATAFSRDLWRRINGVAGDRREGEEEDELCAGLTDEECAIVSNFSMEGILLNGTRAADAWRDAETKRRLDAATEAALAVATSRRSLSELLSTPDLERSRYRKGEAELRACEARMALADLDLALERACAVLERDVDRTETDLDRNTLAEFALLDAQVISLVRDAQYSAGPSILEPELNILSRDVADFCARVGVASRDVLDTSEEADKLLEARQAVVDAELAAVASKDDNFFFAPLQRPQTLQLSSVRPEKASADSAKEDNGVLTFPRLWMASSRNDRDYQRKRRLILLGGAVGDRENTVSPVGRLVAQLEKFRLQALRGLAFYGDGSKLLAADVAFCVSLVGRAFGGETLSQRDVRVFRRTLKDISTTIPFVVILLIPLSPVGHVLVFGAIQR